MAAARADAFLVEKGYFASRAQARAAILAGEVRIDGRPVTKAGQAVADVGSVEVLARPRYVSRGGDKLAAALDAFHIDVTGLRVMDAGASTGGFTDCLLSRGAREVVAVDVGYGQFAWSLRNDPRVHLMERKNIRELNGIEAGPLDAAVADLSFISLRLVVPVMARLVTPPGPMVTLFKPQFEAGKGRVGKGGVIRDASTHVELLSEFAAWADEQGLGPAALAASSPRGADGNIEFFYHLASGSERLVSDGDVAQVVGAAHEGDGS
jgi:23S rRNA (cytidine1920-2'-O)/16S rRNA (cytidine1409-2'-O)-methyltransferase